MALIYFDRVRQKAVASGTGNVTLTDAVANYRTFAQAGIGANSFPYAIISATQFEVGIGLFSAGALIRSTVLSNSNGDTNLVNFSGTLADVIITNAAELSVLVSTPPVNNTSKIVKWVNSEYVLEDPILNASALGAGIQSSVIFYDYNAASFAADPKFKFYPGSLPEIFVDGVLSATAKSFKIPHPINAHQELHHGCLEGPEHGIYFRGSKTCYKSCQIILPDYFQAITKNNYTVHISSNSFFPLKITKKFNYFKVHNLFSFFGKIEFDYLVIASRNDVELVVEKNVR
jgi:hypothetical protein